MNINSLNVSMGISNLHVLDEHANYLIFRGTGIAPSLAYDHITPKSTHSVRGMFYSNRLTSDADNFKTRLLGGQLRYSWLRNITSGAIGLSAGLSVSSTLFKTDYSFYNRVMWLRAIESWYWSHSAGIAVQLKKDWNKNTVNLQIFTPLISNVSRPKYSSSGDYNYEENDWDIKTFGKTLFVTGNSGADIQLLYSRQLSARLMLTAEYEFFYSQSGKPELIRLYMNNFRAGLTYNF